MSSSSKRYRVGVSTGVLLFTIREQTLEVLLVRRTQAPFKGNWVLPGGFVRPDESLEDSARRKLERTTGIAGCYLEQLYTFGRVDRDPRERAVCVAYYALLPADQLTPVLNPGSKMDAVGWFSVDDLPETGFDHTEVVAAGRGRLAAKVDYSTLALQFLPRTFTLSEVQRIYEAVKGHELDKRNFRRALLALGKLKATGAKRQDGFGRPAMTYRIKGRKSVDVIK